MSPLMNGARALPFLLLAVTLSGLACKAPTYEELEKERPRQCNAEHTCADGYTCVNGVCVTGSPQVSECEPNTERACGDFDKGACRKGIQKCGEDGKWDTVCLGEVRPAPEVCNGKDDDCDESTDEQIAPVACALTAGVCAGKSQACVPENLSQVCDASNYGSDYELEESRCDNLDNDCDGNTDEDITQACEKTRGVCAAAVKLCRDGAFPSAACTDDDYRVASNRTYESFELTCDDLDNDCDGNTDMWDARNLSGSSRISTVPVMATLPGGDGLSAVVLFQEKESQSTSEERKVLSQVVGPSGPTVPQIPSATIKVADRAYNAVIGTDGQLLAASWVEQIGTTTRVMLTLLGADGLSVLKDGGATTLFNDVQSLVPGKLSLAVSNGRIAVAMEDFSSGNRPIIRLTTVRASTSAGTITLAEERALIVSDTSDTTNPNREPHVSAAEGDAFNVAWQVGGKGIAVKTVKPDGNFSRNISATGGAGAREAHVFTSLPSGRTLLYYVNPSDTKDSLKVLDCSPNSCSPVANAPFSNAEGGSMSEVFLVTPAFGEQPTVALWAEVGEDGTLPVRYSARADDGKDTLGTLTPNAGKDAHPAAAFVGTGSRRTLVSAFASDGSGGLTPGEVYVRPFCSP